MKSRKVAAGQTLMVGLPGPALDPATARRLEALRPGGIILFARNMENADNTAGLIAEVRQHLAYPLLVAVDQEGGRVSRLEPWIGATPTAFRLAGAGIAATRRFASATAVALRELGFNIDFAPVVDLCQPDETNGIGDRSFGTEPSAAAELAGAFLEGLQSNGVAGCLKHFPGLGATHVDSHEVLPTADRTVDEIDRLDLEPYRRLATRAASVMVGHGHYPVLDAAADRPASLSGAIVTGLLRESIGFRGLVVTDDLEMGAVAPLDDDGRAAVDAIHAGCDLILYCKDLNLAETAVRALVARADGKPAFAARLQQAADAVERTARRWETARPRSVGWEQARRELERSSELT